MAYLTRLCLICLAITFFLSSCIQQPVKKKYTLPKPPKAPTATANVSEVSRITNDSAPEGWPRVSPDGSKLLFHTLDRSKKNMSGYSIVMIEPGKVGRKLIAGPYADMPAWFPDGKNFAYQYLKMRKPIFVRTPVNGVGMTFVSPQPLGDFDSQPDVSPDGKRIAFTTEIGDTMQICCVDTTGSNFTIYTEGQSPRWHPDGNKLLFDRKVGNAFQCFIFDMTNGQVTQLTSGNAYNIYPTWSPDGKWIAFNSNRDGKSHLYAMKSDGSQVTQLTSGGAQETSPEWSSDNTIYFASDAGAPKAQPQRVSSWQYSNIWKLKPILPE